MGHSCFICNVLVGNKNTPDLFAEYMTIDESIARLLTEIVDKTVAYTNIHSKVICKKCYTSCMEFDSSKKRIQEIKSDLTNKFKITLPKHGFDYSVYPKKIAPTVSPKKIVLSASKLQPLPANYVIDVSKIPKNLNAACPTKNSEANAVSTQNKTTTSNTQQKLGKNTSVESNIANSLSSILGTKTSTSVSSNTPMLTFNIDNVPKEFMTDKNYELKNEDPDDDDDEDFTTDEQPMEIDEECTITKRSKEKPEDPLAEKQLFDVSLLSEGANSDTIMGKLQILDQNEEDGEENQNGEEIVLTDESGSVIRLVVPGQKLVYEDGTLTLAATQPRDGDDGNDSNDESQIELQVSGDEETANAIIAAAQEQGGAFIKVESGEMFRVKSVTSKKGSSNENVSPAIYMVSFIDDEDLFKCLLCENIDKESKKCFKGEAEVIMQHLKSVHDARLYICRVCNKVLVRRSLYIAHLAKCANADKSKTKALDGKIKMHECGECDKKFTSRNMLQEHLNTHSGARPYQCSACDKTFSSKYTLQAHLKTHLDRPRPFKCNQCTKSFLTQQNLNQHKKTHLGIKDFVCNICGKAFGTQHNLEVHGVVHSKNKPFICGVCGKPFARRAEVKDHLRIHTGERPFKCDLCGATFTQRSNLNSHKRATHMDDRRYHCGECPKKFKRRRLLDYHVKVCHTGERPLECEICHATFVYPEHYKKHSRIHSGEKPFVCEVCGKSFNSRDNRNTHRFVHSDKKPYECLVCGAGFMRKQLLYAHMNTSGHLAESIVVNQPRVQKLGEKGGATPTKIKAANKLDMISPTETSEELELTTSGSKSDDGISEEQGPQKYVLQEMTQNDDPALLTLIQNLEGKAEPYQSITAEQIGEQVQMVTADENGAIRLVQLHIDSNSGNWVTSVTSPE